MRTLKTLAVAAALLMVAASANAAIILSVVEATNQTANPGLELQVNLEITGGGGMDTLGFDIVGIGAVLDGECDNSGTTSSDTDRACVNNFANQTSFGSQGPDGQGLGWGGFSGVAPDGIYLNIASISATGSPGDVVTLGTLYAGAGFGNDITNTITVNPYTFVPEPTTAALLGLGLFGLALGGRRR